MTILETPSVVVAPTPTLEVRPPAKPPASEPEPGPRRRRRHGRRVSTLLAAVVALGVAATVAEWSPWSGSAPSGALAAAAPPSSVRIVGVTEHSVAFRWSTPLTDASVVAFEIVRDGAVADVVMPVQSTYDATGLAIGRTYRFEVVAVYAGSVSAPSAPIVATTGP